MSIFKFLRVLDNNSRYTVNVVDSKNNKNSLLYETKASRFPRVHRVVQFGKKSLAKITATLTALFMLLLLTIGSATPSQAAGDWGMANPLRDMACSFPIFNNGAEKDILQPSSLKGLDIEKNKLTMYEKYGSAGLKWTVWAGPDSSTQLEGDGDVVGRTMVKMAGGKESGIDTWGKGNSANAKPDTAMEGFFNTTQSCNPFMKNVSTNIANVVLAGSNYVVSFTNELYAFALNSSDSLSNMLGSTVADVTKTLKDALYLEFLTPMIMLGALWMAYVGLWQKKSVEAAQGAVWMIFAAIVSVNLLTNPMLIPNTVQKVTGSILSPVTTAIAKAGTTVGGSESNYCTVTASGNDIKDTIRQQNCMSWYSFGYSPWVQGQYGFSPSVDDSIILSGAASLEGGINGIGTDIKVIPSTRLGSENAVPQTWALRQLDAQTKYPGSSQREQDKIMLSIAANQLYKDNYNSVWKGDAASGRIAIAITALVGAVAQLVLVASVAIPIVVINISILIGLLVAVIFLLAGVHPGFGRRIAIGWANMILGLAIKGIVLNIFLAIIMFIISTVMASSAPLDMFARLITIICLTFAGITFKDQIVNVFKAIKIPGGDNSLTMPEGGGAKKFLGNFAGAALGGAMGAGGAGAAKGSMAIKNNIDAKKTAKDRVAKNNGKGAGDSKNSGNETTTSNSAPMDTGSGRKPFSPSDLPADEPKHSSDNNTSGAGQSKRPPASTEIPTDDGLTNSYSTVDTTPKTKSDIKNEIKTETRTVKDENLRNGVSNGPSVVGTSAKAAVAGWKAGGLGGVTAGAGVAKNEATQTMAENELLQSERDKKYEGELSKLVRDQKKVEQEQERAKRNTSTPNPRPTSSEQKKESSKSTPTTPAPRPTSKATEPKVQEPKVQAPKVESQGGLPPLTPRTEKGRVISLPNLGGNSTGERPKR